MPKVKLQPFNVVPTLNPEDIDQSGGKYEDIDYVNGGEENGYPLNPEKETKGGIVPLLVAKVAAARALPMAIRTAKTLGPKVLKSMGTNTAKNFQQQAMQHQFAPPPQLYTPYRGGALKDVAKSYGKKLAQQTKKQAKGVGNIALSEFKATPEYQQLKAQAIQSTIASPYGQAAYTLSQPGAVERVTQQAVRSAVASPQASSLGSQLEYASSPQGLQKAQQYAPPGQQFIQPTFRPGQFKVKGGNDVSQKLVENDAKEVQASPQEFEKMEVDASRAIDVIKAKAQNEYAQTVDAVKIEEELVPTPVVEITKKPVKVAGPVKGGEVASRWIIVLIVIGIAILIYVICILFQPSLTGRWGDQNGKHFIDIDYNRFTKKMTIESTKPIVVGRFDKKIIVPVGIMSAYLDGNKIKINGGLWGYWGDNKDVIIQDIQKISYIRM